uniref:NADH:ubiquinone reductase (H(+)-translocating) n=1 Tax=Riccardoella tokyoensis TaxID=2073164 RepID=A0A7R7Z712_9ACAR|nr:NADH dehydrogenase subunit 5 [Riccardoella tokyoensis]
MVVYKLFVLLYMYLHFLTFFFMLFLDVTILLEFNFLGLSSIWFNVYIILDKYSISFCSFIFMISMAVMLYSMVYMKNDENKIRFLILVNLFVISMLVLVLMPNMLGVMLGWDGLGISSFLLVIYYQNISSLQSGLITIYMNRFGDVMVLFSIFFMYNTAYLMVDSFMYKSIFFFAMALLFGGMTKSAQMPFSSWLPVAMSAPTPVSSLVHSSTLVTAGVYLFFRFYYMMEEYFISSLFSYVSLLTSFMSGLVAYMEVDLKKMVAMSTLSQLGVMMFMISIGELYVCYFHMISHALFKALLFLSCGSLIMYSYGGQDMRFMGSMSIISPFSVFLMNCSNLSLIGFPFLSGFYSKDMMLEIYVGYSSSVILFSLFMMSCLFSVMYMIKMVYFSISAIRLGSFFIKSFMNYSLFISMLLLLIWVIILGKIMFLEMFFYSIYMISMLDKLFGSLLLVMGVCMFLYIHYLSNSGSKFLLNYIMSIGFLSWFFSGVFMKFLLVGNDVIMFDSLWLELFSKKGTLSLITSLNKNSIFILKIVKSIVMILLMLAFFLLMFLSYSLYKV